MSAAATRFRSVDNLLADARSRLARVTPEQAFAQVAAGARIVDIRPAWQREVDGEIPGALVVERNHLEWRLHPDSQARVAQAVAGQRWIVLCQEGYTSSLAADALLCIGVPATDIIGGIRSWRAASLPIAATVTRPNTLVHWPRRSPGRSVGVRTARPCAFGQAVRGRSYRPSVGVRTGRPWAFGRLARAADGTVEGVLWMLRPRWLTTHAVVLVSATAMILLGRWQLDVGNSGGSGEGSLLNYGYALQWWVFAGFAVFIWVRLVRDQSRRQAVADGRLAVSEGPDAKRARAAAPKPAPYFGYAMPQMKQVTASDPDLVAYNAHLGALNPLPALPGRSALLGSSASPGAMATPGPSVLPGRTVSDESAPAAEGER